jgi:hypothetical protein
MHTLAEKRAAAEKIACSYHSPRYLKLDRLERYAAGTQYKGRPSWWNDSVPLQERAPCLRAPIAERAIRGHVDLSLGEGRFPRITTHLSEDDSAFDEDHGLTKEASQLLDRFIQQIVDQAKLSMISTDGMTGGLECGTTVAIAKVTSEGRLAVDTELAKHCMPKLGPDGEVLELEIRYPYLVDVRSKEPGNKEWDVECRLYRRVIDEQVDTTFLPAKATEGGGEPDAWIPDPVLTVQHNLGFVPAIWWRRARRCTTVADIDGIAPHVNLLDEIDGLNVSLSQRHRAARYAGDPQIVEYGVQSEDDVKTPQGRSARTLLSGADDHPGNRSFILDHGGQPMRRKGPGSIWTYTDKGAKCEYLTLPTGALESLVGDIRELYAMIRDALGYVDMDPSNVKSGADLSGRTIEWLYQNAVNFCNRLRPDFADGYLIPLVSLLLRLVAVKHRAGEALKIPGFAKVAPIVAKFEQDGQWQPPNMRCIWGSYFTLSETDKKAKQERVLAALEGGIITRQTAIEEIAHLYPTIKDPAAYLEALELEQQEKMAQMHESREALTNAGKGLEGEPEDGSPVEAEEDDAAQPAPKTIPKKPGVSRLRKRATTSQ